MGISTASQSTDDTCHTDVTFRLRSTPFSIGESVRDMTLIKILKKASQIRKWRYRVKADVCGHEIDLSHKTLLDKRRAAYPGMCKDCMRKQKRIDVIAERLASNDENKEADLSFEEPNRLKTERAADREEQLANRWSHALWSRPGGELLPPHRPTLGLVNRVIQS